MAIEYDLGSDLVVITGAYWLAKKSKVFAMKKFSIPGKCSFGMVMRFLKHDLHTSLLAFEIHIAQANVMGVEFGNPRVKQWQADAIRVTSTGAGF